MRLLPVLVFSLAFFLRGTAARAGADTSLHFDSEYNGAVTEETTLTAAGGDAFGIGGYNGNSVQFKMSNGSAAYLLTLSAPTGSTLAVGNYPQAAPDATAAAPGLSFLINGLYDAPDSGYPGQFEVLEITSDAGGNLVSFAANFVEHPFGDSSAIAGQIRYHSAVPSLLPAGTSQFALSHYRVLAVDGNVTLTVTRHDGGTGPLSVDYATADGTDLAGRDYPATTGTLSWADGDTTDKTLTVPVLDAGNPSQGDGTFVVNLSGPGAGAEAQAVVTVINNDSAITFLHFQSDAGADYGGGQERTFNIANRFATNATHQSDGAVSFGFYSGDNVDFQDAEDWEVSMQAPNGAPLGVGDYQDTVRYLPYQSAAHPGLSYEGDGSGGNAQTGNFQVLEAEYDADGKVVRFAANFEIHTLGQEAGLYGQIRYRSTVPLPPARHVSVEAGVVLPTISGHGYNAGTFTLARSGNDLSAPLSVAYKVVGSAVSGQDYTALKGTKKIKAGKRTAQVSFRPINRPANGSGNVIVKLKVLPQAGNYDAVGKGSAKILLLEPTQ